MNGTRVIWCAARTAAICTWFKIAHIGVIKLRSAAAPA